MEFALSISVFLALISFVFDLGFGLFKANLLKQSTIVTSRELSLAFAQKIVPRSCRSSIDSVDGSRCSELADCAERILAEQGQRQLPHYIGKVSYSAALTDADGAAAALKSFDTAPLTYYNLEVSAQVENGCLFCGLLPSMLFRTGNQAAVRSRLACVR